MKFDVVAKHYIIVKCGIDGVQNLHAASEKRGSGLFPGFFLLLQDVFPLARTGRKALTCGGEWRSSTGRGGQQLD